MPRLKSRAWIVGYLLPLAVLAVTDNGILLGDPATGLRTVPPDDFARIWRFTAITMARTLPRE